MTKKTTQAADAIIHVCRVASRMTEFATHEMVGEYDDGVPHLDFHPIVLDVIDEELPGSVEGDAIGAVKATFPHYTLTFTRALAAYEQIKAIRKEAPPEYWQWSGQRTVPWSHEGTASMKEYMDRELSALFWYARRLYEVNATL